VSVVAAVTFVDVGVGDIVVGNGDELDEKERKERITDVFCDKV
jgi:hypothetical protein